MKKILSGFLALVLTASAAQAQDTTFKKHGKHGKEHKMHAMKGLDLSEEQKTKMKALNADFKKQHEELKKQESTLTVTQMKERRKELAQQHRTQVQSILTAEQKAKMEQAKKEGKGRGKYKGGKARREEAHRVHDELNLSAEQQAKMKDLREDFRSKAEAIRKNKSLNKEAQKKALKELHEKNKEQMKMVLTKEQLDKIEAQRGKRPQKNSR